MATSEDSRPVESVQSLQRGLAVIRAFDADHPRMTLSEVARRTDLTRATARRFLHTLVALGYTDTDGREFWLRPRVLELGYAYLSGSSLPEIATPHLKNLTDKVHESSSVSVLDGTEIVYVARVHTRRLMAVAINVGTRFPAYATSMGRVLLANLDVAERDAVIAATDLKPLTPSTITTPKALKAELARVREQGYAVVDQELEIGLRSMAAPIRDAAGRTVAAANISMSATQRSTEEAREELLPLLIETTTQIAHDLRVAAH